MAQTIVEKIISKHVADDNVFPGAIVTAEIDLLIANELSTALAVDIIETMDSLKIMHPDRLALVIDHVSPNKDLISAELTKRIRNFARDYRREVSKQKRAWQ